MVCRHACETCEAGTSSSPFQRIVWTLILTILVLVLFATSVTIMVARLHDTDVLVMESPRSYTLPVGGFWARQAVWHVDNLCITRAAPEMEMNATCTTTWTSRPDTSPWMQAFALGPNMRVDMEISCSASDAILTLMDQRNWEAWQTNASLAWVTLPIHQRAHLAWTMGSVQQGSNALLLLHTPNNQTCEIVMNVTRPRVAGNPCGTTFDLDWRDHEPLFWLTPLVGSREDTCLNETTRGSQAWVDLQPRFVTIVPLLVGNALLIVIALVIMWKSVAACRSAARADAFIQSQMRGYADKHVEVWMDGTELSSHGDF